MFGLVGALLVVAGGIWLGYAVFGITLLAFTPAFLASERWGKGAAILAGAVIGEILWLAFLFVPGGGIQAVFDEIRRISFMPPEKQVFGLLYLPLGALGGAWLVGRILD